MKKSTISFIALFLLVHIFCTAQNNKKPNFIIIFTDDQGYQDLTCFGSPDISTPNLDQLATEGIRATNFYVAASVCSASRAALLTGKYPANNNVGGVFFPDANGMNAEEETIAEVLQGAGYYTACFGKWHLGDLAGHLPNDQGFNYYYGIPYSNDMYIGSKLEFDKAVKFNKGYNLEKAKADQAFCATNTKSEIKAKGIKELVPLMQNSKIIEYPCEQSTLTHRYFQKAIDLINADRKDPFFIYLTPAMPHVPLYAATAFKGKSEAGLYGDVIQEIDHYVGKIKTALVENGIDDNTAIIFTSDNGPWLGYKDHAGRSAPLRDGKFTNYEGGVRVPCIFNWPTVWDAGINSDAILSSINIKPTLAHYAGVKKYAQVDGVNMSSYLEDTDTDKPNEVMIYSKGTDIHGIRKGDWKLLIYGGSRHANKKTPPELFNLKNDISETHNLYSQYPEIVKELLADIEKCKK